MIVVDASAVLMVLLNPQGGGQLERYLKSGGPSLAAPHLIDLEVAQVLRRLIRNKAMTSERSQQALRDWQEMRMTRFAHHPLMKRIFELRDNATAYDAAYLALAEALDAPLLTHDAKFKTVPGHKAQIVLI